MLQRCVALTSSLRIVSRNIIKYAGKMVPTTTSISVFESVWQCGLAGRSQLNKYFNSRINLFKKQEKFFSLEYIYTSG